MSMSSVPETPKTVRKPLPLVGTTTRIGGNTRLLHRRNHKQRYCQDMFDPGQFYPSQGAPVAASDDVATLQLLAVQAGLDCLRCGGNAIDAAPAATITLGIQGIQGIQGHYTYSTGATS